MARILILQSAALIALAATGALVASPVFAQDEGRGSGNWRRAPAEERAQVPEGDARQQQRVEAQQERQQPRAERVPDPARQQARVERQQGRIERQQQRGEVRQQRSAPDGGWRSQRADGGERYGRDWDNSGAVSRPAPAWRGADPANPERGSIDRRERRADRADRQAERDVIARNRGYTDTERNRSYRDEERRAGYRDGTRYGSDRYRDGRRWDRNNWRQDRRYDWRSYRTYNRDAYRVGRYYSPYRDYRYRRLGIGFSLDNLFFGNRYWINDPWQYRLPEVYGPYRWVRYYDDVLLVDIYTGEVVDVIHDFFW